MLRQASQPDWLVRTGRLVFRVRNFVFPFAYLLVLIPAPRISAHPLSSAQAGLALIICGQLVRALTIGLVYVVRGGRNRQVYAEDLVTGGLYSHSRNPMYVGNLLIVFGFAVASNSWVALPLAVLLGVFAYLAITAAEEDYLRGRFGAQFDNYCARVPRFLPRLRGLATTLRGMRFHWRRVLVKEYGTPFGWVIAWCAVLYYNLWLTRDPGDQKALAPHLLAILAVVLVFWVIVRTLKKRRVLVAD